MESLIFRNSRFIEPKVISFWICFGQLLLFLPPIFQTVDYPKLPISLKLILFCFLSKILFQFVELFKIRKPTKTILASCTPDKSSAHFEESVFVHFFITEQLTNLSLSPKKATTPLIVT